MGERDTERQRVGASEYRVLEHVHPFQTQHKQSQKHATHQHTQAQTHSLTHTDTSNRTCKRK